MNYVLYGTTACHLCDQVEEMLATGKIRAMLKAQSASLDYVDVSSSNELFERYGYRIPVLRNESSGRELAWPFSIVELRAFVG